MAILSKSLPVAVILLALMGAFVHQALSREVTPKPVVAPGAYSSLSDLVGMIGGDAAGQFRGFFDAGPVRVEPFPVLSEFPGRRISVLGATLADQMAAVINTTPGSGGHKADEGSAQFLRGVIQELDGQLRVHISARNSRGQWRSYVAGVEMSEAVFRAMHTYVSYER